MPGYITSFEGYGQFDPNGKVNVADPDAHNKALEAEELALWAMCPDRFLVYVIFAPELTTGQRRVTTFLGTVLGTLLEHRRVAHNMRTVRSMMHVRFRGTNGAIYYGRYNADWSQVVRVRKALQRKP
jgi:hypothetical protein